VHEALRLRVKLLVSTMRALATEEGEQDAFLISATRLGGRHGYDAAGATSVLGGALTGFTKALARERPDALVKAVDFPPSRKTAAIADLLVEETLRDPGAVEVGYADDLRWSVGLVVRDASPDPERALRPDSVFVITGAAGSIVSATTQDLARAAGGGTFHLLDLVSAPDPDDPDLERFVSDKEGLKSELIERIKGGGERPTPKLVERELAGIERARAALDAIEAIQAAGGESRWHQVDLTDAAAVEEALAELRGRRVDVLLHCAGLEISHFLPDKPQREYDLVFDVKVDGWFALLHALRDSEIGAAGAFCSISGRFGNAGQTDYAAANDLVCKSVSNFRRSRPDTFGVAIDWTAWAGIGMAARGSIPKMMEAAGIAMMPPEIGVPVVRRELTAAGDSGEVVIASTLGLLTEERHPTGGIDPDLATTGITAPKGPMTGRVAAMTLRDGLVVVTDLDPSRQAFLNDHRIDGTPVLPGVMGMEGFAEAARALLPGWHVVSLEDVELQAPFKFYRDEPRALELRALLREGPDGTIEADCRLVGRRELPGQGEQETVHFSGRALLARQVPEPPLAESSGAEEAAAAATVDSDAVYRVYFHGPAYQVLDSAWRGDGTVVGRLADPLPPAYEPPGQPTEIAPRLVELCFQTAGVRELGTIGRMALPTHVDRVQQFAGVEEAGPLWAVVRPRDGDDGVDAEVVGPDGRARVRLEGYRTIELPGGLDPQVLEPIRSAIG
jgi:NAD(P)-dependent dehydrogenase (short-subunit alcohol dehydrogenase family)